MGGKRGSTRASVTFADYQNLLSSVPYCPASMGREHSFVDTVCDNCGMSQDATPAPDNRPFTSLNRPGTSCPATTGGEHMFDLTQRCVNCGACFEDRSLSRSSSRQMTPSAPSGRPMSQLQRIGTPCPATTGGEHEFAEGKCMNCDADEALLQ